MSIPRRRIIRPIQEESDRKRQRQRDKLQARLEGEQKALARWQTKLKRAFNTVAKHMKTIVRIDKQLAQLKE